MNNYEFDMIKLNDKYWIKVLKSPDKPFGTWRDPVTGHEKLSYMEMYDCFGEADEAADVWFERNGYIPQEIGEKVVYVWLIDRKIGSLLQARDLETATVDDCVLVQYRVFSEPAEEQVWDKDDGVYVTKNVRYEEVFSCLVKKNMEEDEEEEDDCDEKFASEQRLVPRTED